MIAKCNRRAQSRKRNDMARVHRYYTHYTLIGVQFEDHRIRLKPHAASANPASPPPAAHAALRSRAAAATTAATATSRHVISPRPPHLVPLYNVDGWSFVDGAAKTSSWLITRWRWGSVDGEDVGFAILQFWEHCCCFRSGDGRDGV